MVLQEIIFIALLLPLQEIKTDDGEFEIVLEDIPFVEFEENGSSTNEFIRVMSKDEWLHLNSYPKVTKGTITKVSNTVGTDSSAFCRTLKTCSACVAKNSTCNWCQDSGCGDRKTCKKITRACPTITEESKSVVKDPSVFCRTLKTCSACVAKKKTCNWCQGFGCGDRKTCKNTRRACPKITEKSRKFVKKPSFICQSLKTCSECVSKSSSCHWCHDFGCGDHEACNNTTPACPIIGHEGKLLIPAGVNHSISLQLNFPNPDLLWNRLTCVIKKAGRVILLPAVYSNVKSQIMCEQFVFDTEGEIDQGSLRVMWGGFTQFSNKLSFLIYNCRIMAPDCASCRLILPEYGCGWCSRLNYCTTVDQCHAGATKWLCLTKECESCWIPLQ